MEAMRCLKRRLSDVVYRQLLTDSRSEHEKQPEAGSEGHRGASLNSSAADLTPHVGTSDQPQPEPAGPTLPASMPGRNPGTWSRWPASTAAREAATVARSDSWSRGP
jgi:hypothetical protein